MIGAGAGASSDASVTSGATTQAVVGSTSSIGAPGVVIQVLADSSNNAHAVARGNVLSIGLSISIMLPSASVDGGTKANFDGDVTTAAGLTVRSRTANSATADAHIASISLVGGGAGGDANATVGSAAATKRRSVRTP